MALEFLKEVAARFTAAVVDEMEEFCNETLDLPIVLHSEPDGSQPGGLGVGKYVFTRESDGTAHMREMHSGLVVDDTQLTDEQVSYFHDRYGITMENTL